MIPMPWDPEAWAALGPPLANHLWQSTLFAAAAGLLTLMLKKNRAQPRYCLWLAASFKFLVPFSLLVAIGGLFEWRGAAAAAPPLQAAIERIGEPVAPLPPSRIGAPPTRPTWASAIAAPALLGAVWLFGCAAVLSMWWRRYRRVRTAMRAASPLPNVLIGARVEVRSSSTLLEPGVFGIFRPVLLLPAGIAKRLTPTQLRAILAHELCHVRRRDNLASAVHMVVEAIFWFHPLIWWLGSRLVDERERACDEEVLRRGSEPEVYAEGILKTCELYLKSPLACVAGVTGSNLADRIERIMTDHVGQALTLGRKLLVGAAGAAAMAVPLSIGIAKAPHVRAQAQSGPGSDGAVAFEVASIRPAAPQTGRIRSLGGMRSDPGRVSYTNVSMRQLLQRAYGVRPQQISGPGWLDSDRFDIVAKLPEGAANDRVPHMLRSLLTERFKLTLRFEKRDMPVYALVVSRRGPKLEKAEDGEPVPGKRTGIGIDNGSHPGWARVTGYSAALSLFADSLTNMVGRPVLDETGMQGNYNFTFEVSADEIGVKKPGPAGPGTDAGGTAKDDAGPAPDGVSGPSIFSAIQKLGLKLEERKAPLDFIIVEKGNRTPTEN